MNENNNNNCGGPSLNLCLVASRAVQPAAAISLGAVKTRPALTIPLHTK